MMAVPRFQRFQGSRVWFCWVLLALASIGACADGALPRLPSVVQEKPTAYKPEEIQITLSRTICFGSCPSYWVQIFGDGTVKYEGMDFVAVKGTRENKIAGTEVVKLVNAFLAVEFFGLPNYDGSH